MVELFEQNIRIPERQSSKGNQLKWEDGGIWYKADYAGYEGLSEYVVSNLLRFSSLDESEFVLYDLEEIKYKKNIYKGVRSRDFLHDDWQIITLERLFKNRYGKSLYEEVWHIEGVESRIQFLNDQVRNITGLSGFGIYMNKLMTIDAVFLNEDRHMHNIAVMMNSKQEFDYCRIFDNGASLLSDTTMDYPLGEDVYSLIDDCHSKTVSRDFIEQIEASEMASGHNLKFAFSKNDVREILDNCVGVYDAEIIKRVENVLYYQMRKYQYLFS